MDRLLVTCADAADFESAWLALSSFQRHNNGWSVLVMDVGLTPAQAEAFGQLATVVRYPREETPSAGPAASSSRAHCMALAEIPGPENLLLYIDPSTIMLGPLDSLVEAFLASGRPVGIAVQTGKARDSWAEDAVPDSFPRRQHWQDAPHLDAGFLLAVDSTAGDRCLNLYDKLRSRFRRGAQTLIESVLYEDQVPLFPIPGEFYREATEELLASAARETGELPVVIRPSRGPAEREIFDRWLPKLLDLYPLPPGMAILSRMAPRSKCVVIVPVGSSIEPHCEHGLHELERRGYQVRRGFGHSAIDFGRSILASQAIADGFEEIMWIDSDVGFDPDDVDKLRGHGLPICCGLYAKKNGQGFACSFLPGTTRVTFGNGGGLREVLYAGFGFVYTRKEIYERIKETSQLPECNQRFGAPMTPWFFPELAADGSGRWYLAEDYAFCHRVRQCGYKVIADTTIRLTHVGRHPFTWEDIMARPVRYQTLELRLEDPAPNSQIKTLPSALVEPYGPLPHVDGEWLLCAD